jgi:hypothetical protein
MPTKPPAGAATARGRRRARTGAPALEREPETVRAAGRPRRHRAARVRMHLLDVALGGREIADVARATRPCRRRQHPEHGLADLFGESHVALTLALGREVVAADEMSTERDLRRDRRETGIVEARGEHARLGGDRQALVDPVRPERRPVAGDDRIAESRGVVGTPGELPGFARQRLARRHRERVRRRTGEPREDARAHGGRVDTGASTCLLE